MQGLLASLQSEPSWGMAVGIALLCVMAVVFGAMLRWARMPGGAGAAGIAGGMVAALLLGPTVLGVAAPEWREAMFDGAAAHRMALEHARGELRAEVAALRASGVSEVAIDEHAAAKREEVEQVVAAWKKARGEFGATRDRAMRAVIFFALLPAIVGSLMTRRASRRDMRRGWGAGAVAFALPWTLAAVGVWVFVEGAGLREAALFGVASGIVWFAPARAMRDAGRRGALLSHATLAALALSATALLIAAGLDRDAMLRLALVAGIVFAAGAMYGRQKPRRTRRRGGGRLGLATLLLLGAIAGATATIDIDWLAVVGEPSFWIGLVVLGIASTDGRWFGAAMGLWLFDRAARRESLLRGGAPRFAAGHVASYAGVTQAAAVALFARIGGASLALLAAATIAALLAAMSVGIYRWYAREGAERLFGRPE